MSLRSVYSEQFFNMPHPSAPFVSIQMRTEINPNDDISDSSHWEEITFNPNNFFNNLEIEDNGGVYNLKLNLFDKNFSYLENIITRSIIATKASNDLVRNPGYAVEQEYFEFYISRSNSTNLRIRFGYSEGSMENYVSSTSFASEEWKNRTNLEKPTLKTPWIYFQMSNANFKFTPKGLEVEIEAFSIMSNFLQKAKLVETYARLYGTPEYVMRNVCDRIVASARRNDENLTYTIRSEPRGYPSQENGEEIIEIMLGGEPTVTGMTADGSPIIQPAYRNLRTILNDICSSVRPIKYDDEGNLIPFSPDTGPEAEGIQEENEQVAHMFRYSYYINETEDGTEIIFDYQDPNASLREQGSIKVYSWPQEGKSIVKDLQIETNTDFSMLNVPVVTLNSSNGEITAQVMRGSGITGNMEDEMDLSVGHIRNVSEAFAAEGFQSVFMRHVEETSGGDLTNGRDSANFLSSRVADRIALNINQQVFKGTLTLFGDPSFLFDEKMQPFSYLIKIIVNRPNYVAPDGSIVNGGKSYLSGYYAITKITHSVSRSGFETVLEIMKFNSHGR